MTDRKTKPTRPLLIYHGGKWLLAPWIIQHFPPHFCYVEPYGGGGSVLLRKERSRGEVYNDLDSELVNLFRVVRDHGEALRILIELTPFSRMEYLGGFEPSLDPIEQARRTVLRSFMGFGSTSHIKRSGFRVKTHNAGTESASEWRNFPAALGATIERLRGVAIENQDAIKVMMRHDTKATLHYVDPPYVKSTRDAGNDYRFEMTDEQHHALADVLHRLKGMVVLSGYNSPLYKKLFAGWQRVERKARAANGGERTEVLWLRNIKL